MIHLSTAQPGPTAHLPVIDDPQAAVSGILNALLKLTEGVTRKQQRALLAQLGTTYHLDNQEARDLAMLGNWLASESAEPAAAVRDLSAVLDRLKGDGAGTAHRQLDAMATAVFGADAPGLWELARKSPPPAAA